MKLREEPEAVNELASFFVADDAPEWTPVDRTTIENFMTCPAMGQFINSGRVRVFPQVLTVGDLGHAAFGRATQAYVDSQGSLGIAGVIEELENALLGSRPDLQPQVIRYGKGSLYPWARFICGIDPTNLLRWDGGPGDRSGQITWNLPGFDFAPTSEIDLLYQGPSRDIRGEPLCLHEVDYKGLVYTVQGIRDAFQFQTHAWLVLENYPKVECLEITVWNPRTGQRSRVVPFLRKDLPAFRARVHAAAGDYYRWRDVAPEQCETRPTVEKCSECLAAVACPAYGPQLEIVSGKPESLVDELTALTARTAALESHLTRCCRERGSDVVSASGNAWGLNKPKRATPPKCGLYAVRGAEETNGEEPEETPT